jgi:aspartate/tyrosine/aromatic aminotransferase
LVSLGDVVQTSQRQKLTALQRTIQVTMILTNPELFEDWKRDIKTMSGRIIEMRQVLFDLLDKKYKTPPPGERKDWSHIKSQIVSGVVSTRGLGVALLTHSSPRRRACSRSPVSTRSRRNVSWKSTRST